MRPFKHYLLKIISKLSRLLLSYYDYRQNPEKVIIIKDSTHYSPDFSKIKKDNERFTNSALKSIKLDPLFYVQEKNALLVGNGIILSSQGQIILESTIFQKEYFLKLGQNHLILSRFLKKQIQPEKTILSLSNVLEDNYYHWIMESVTRVLLIENLIDLQSVTILINDNRNSFKTESLNFLFKISDIKVKPTKDVYRGDFIIPSFTHTRNTRTSMTDICHPIIIRNLNKKIFDRFNSHSTGSFPLKFILSRKNASGRKILNEEFLINELQDKGFEIIETDNLTFEDQIQLFFYAQIVISTHGAGLTNIIFSKEITVVELFPEERNKRDTFCFTQISAALGFNHHLLTYSSHNNEQDLVIDTTMLINIKAIIEGNS